MAEMDAAGGDDRTRSQAREIQRREWRHVAGAAKFGFRTVWVNRSGQPDEYADLKPDLILPSLEGLLKAG
jgi:2-haloacid dehalogenase